MEPNPFSWQARCAARCGSSGKRRNAPDGRIWPTFVLKARLRHDEGRFLAPAGHRSAPLVVNHTTARSMPRQQTREIGQMTKSNRISL